MNQKKHKGKSGYENMYLVAKHIYMDNGNVNTVGFAIDKENLWILKAKIDAASINDSISNQEKILDK